MFQRMNLFGGSLILAATLLFLLVAPHRAEAQRAGRGARVGGGRYVAGSYYRGGYYGGRGYYGGGAYYRPGYYYGRGYGYRGYPYGDWRYPYAYRYRYGGYPYAGFYWGYPSYWGSPYAPYPPYSEYAYSPSHYLYTPDYETPAAYSSSPESRISAYPPETVLEDPTPPKNAARVIIRVPAEAQVWFDQTATKQTGAVREFVTPELAAGREFTYSVRAKWQDGGKTKEQTRLVHVKRGSVVMVDFTNRWQPSAPAAVGE
jgi:uncharacterized protein (TIGR03000 family)